MLERIKGLPRQSRDVLLNDLLTLQARDDFPFFCEYVHDRPLYAHQRVWAEELQREGAKTLIVAPPGSLKSTTVSYFIEWCIGRDTDYTCLYLMNTAEQARSKVSSIGDTIETNRKYKAVFPHVVPDRPRGWSHDRLFVQRENTNNPDATVYGTGFDGPYQGVHIKQIFIDDPTDQQDVYSEATMEQQRQRVKGVILDRLLPGGSIVGILTRWGINDLTGDLQDIGLRKIENPVVGDYPWGELLCPEMFSYEDLEELERVKGEGLYAMTYLCNPAILAAQMLYFDARALTDMAADVQQPRDYLRGLLSIWQQPVVAGKYILAADTAWGKTGSFNCAAVFDYQTGTQMAELHARLGRDEMAQEVMDLHVKYNHAYMGLERAGEGQDRDGESVVVVNKVVELLNDCSCSGRLFYSDHLRDDPEKPGWQTDGTTRPVMLGEFAEAVLDRSVIIRSREGLDEMLSFIRTEAGRPEAASGKRDDRVITYAIMWKMRKYAIWDSVIRTAVMPSFS